MSLKDVVLEIRVWFSHLSLDLKTKIYMQITIECYTNSDNEDIENVYISPKNDQRKSWNLDFNILYEPCPISLGATTVAQW